MSQKSRSVEAVNTSSPAAEAQQKSSGISRPAVDPFQLKKSLPFSASAYAPGAGVVQRNSFEDYDTYEEAKDATTYSKALLDKQKDDRIEDHFQKRFDPEQQEKIYKANKRHYGGEDIISDLDQSTVLVKQDTKLVPHIDHRFPKSRGGSNSHANAAVLPAEGNIKKSNKLELSEEPTTPLAPYKYMGLTTPFADNKVGTFREFSSEQRAQILSDNRLYYDKGSPVSDVDGKTKLARYDTTRIPHIDHITAKGEGGTNFYFNAAVLPASSNMIKSGKKGRQFDLSYAVGNMTLKEYYEKKAEGALPFGSAIEDDNRDGSQSD